MRAGATADVPGETAATTAAEATSGATPGYGLVVVANRLPVDLVDSVGGSMEWRTSPGGLVSALKPVMQRSDGAWVGWSGSAGEAPAPFDVEGMHLVGVPLSGEEVEDFYEGFSNTTLWPLYHDVIAPPQFHRPWWNSYLRVNERFAAAAAVQASPGGRVWVHDYQLQLVPAMLRSARPDLRIGFFNHIPFPGSSSSRSCRGGAMWSRGCSARTWSASSDEPTPPTSSAPAADPPACRPGAQPCG